MKYFVVFLGLFLFLGVGCKTQKAAVKSTETVTPAQPEKPVANVKPAEKPAVNEVEADVVRTIYTKLPNSRIMRCQDKAGAIVYEASMNAYDGPKTIFDHLGEKLGTVSPWSKESQAQFELDKCEDLFVPEKNIWGVKPVDVFGLRD